MRTVKVAVIALIGGFVGGIVLSELVGIAGFVLFDRAVGLRFLPIYLAVVCAGVALTVDALARRGSHRPAHRPNRRPASLGFARRRR